MTITEKKILNQLNALIDQAQGLTELAVSEQAYELIMNKFKSDIYRGVKLKKNANT